MRGSAASSARRRASSAAPFELHAGRGLTPAQLVQRLNDVGYAERAKTDAPGEFSIAAGVDDAATRTGRDDRQTYPRRFLEGQRRRSSRKLVDLQTGQARRTLTLEAPCSPRSRPGRKTRATCRSRASRSTSSTRSWRSKIAGSTSTPASIRSAPRARCLTNLRGDQPYLVGGSTLTQQIIKNMFLTPEKTLQRKLQEQFMAVVLESRFTKDQILELYLNDVVARSARTVRDPRRRRSRAHLLRQGRPQRHARRGGDDGRPHPVAVAPVAVPQSGTRAERRNVVLREMAEAEFITDEEATKAAATSRCRSQTRALENEAPYFVDYVSQQRRRAIHGLLRPETAVDVYTTLDLHLQRIAQEALAEGLARIDKQLAARKRKPASRAGCARRGRPAHR